jgi:SAM-dependent methyltransferase
MEPVDPSAASALWDAHANADPLWAVLSIPEKRGRRWRLQEFMRNGEREIALLMRQLAALQVPDPQAPVLDFGCGVGRLTQALGRRFDDVIGADISPAMIDLARRINRYPDRVRYICTADAGIETLPARSFRFIYSNIVLQHVAPELSTRYLAEFFRLLDGGGLLVFQLPSHRESTEALEIVPMTEDAYRGCVALAGSVPDVVSPGEEIAVPILVRNSSARTWSQPGAGPMAAGNHWLDASGSRMLHQDDGRAPLPQSVRGGSECRLVLRMRAPAEPGRYLAEIDLVHEGVTWFEHKGSPTLRFPLEVRPGHGLPAVEDRIALNEYPVPEYPEDLLSSGTRQVTPDAEPFPMYAVPHEEVLALIRRHGGTVLHVEEDRRAGPDWVSYAYYVAAP